MLPVSGLEVVEVEEDDDIECLAVSFLVESDQAEESKKERWSCELAPPEAAGR